MTDHTPYVPSEADVQSYYAKGRADIRRQMTGEKAIDVTPYSHDFDRFLARVRQDAAREALDGLAEDQEQFAREIPAFGGQAHRLAGAARNYRDTHYPRETP